MLFLILFNSKTTFVAGFETWLRKRQVGTFRSRNWKSNKKKKSMSVAGYQRSANVD